MIYSFKCNYSFVMPLISALPSPSAPLQPQADHYCAHDGKSHDTILKVTPDIYKEVKFKDLWEILIDSAKTTGGIMLIVACASLFSFVCTRFGISTAASELLARVAGNQFTFLLICNIIFLIAGCFIDANSAMYIFIPIMLPVCKALGYNVIAFGIMATVNLAIGQVTPPVGVNLFVAISVKLKKGMEVTIQQISKAVMPMIAASVAVLLLITYVPQISTFLPKALAKDGAYTGTVAAAQILTRCKEVLA
mgnify:CR=1 FL=1